MIKMRLVRCKEGECAGLNGVQGIGEFRDEERYK